MSAVASIVSKQGAILLSDGMQVKIPAGAEFKQGRNLDSDNWETHATDKSKLIKINYRVGITWVGCMIPSIQDSLAQTCTDKGLTEPEEVANYLSELLKQHFRSEGISDFRRLTGTPMSVNISVNGYDRQGTPWGVCITCNRDAPLEPAKYKLAQNGLDVGVSMLLVDNQEAKAKMQEFWNSLANKSGSMSIEELATKSFVEMVARYASQGIKVGGKIFVERLRP